MLMKILIVVFLSGISNADVVIECNNSSDTRLSFLPSNDGVEGRYRVEWCTLPKSKETVTSWELTLRYANRPAEECHRDSILYRGQVHSFFDKDVNFANLNCTNVCLSTTLDLIFNGTCYQVKTFLHYGGISESPDDKLFYVTNAFPMEHFTRSGSRIVRDSFKDEQLFATWYLSYVPATEYTMNLCSVLNTTKEEYCEVVTRNCSVVGARQTEVQCSVRAPYGWYNMRLQHSAPWDASELFRHLINANHEFEHVAEPPLAVESANRTLWWTCGALVLALALAALLAALCRRRREGVVWPPQGSGGGGGKSAEAAASARDKILLVYARDCAHVMRVAALLRALLARVTDDKVYDVFTMETWREAAGASGEWVRRAVTRDDVRVVLLQTPAAAQLCTGGAGQDLKLEQPLLGRRVVYRAPCAADALVSLALRLLHETAHTQPAHAYRKCYKATISGLQVDLAPTVTPLRRYDLPKDILLLLRDLDPDLFPRDSSQSPLPLDDEFKQELEEFYRAVDDLLAYVRDNPGYLNDEVLCI